MLIGDEYTAFTKIYENVFLDYEKVWKKRGCWAVNPINSKKHLIAV